MHLTLTFKYGALKVCSLLPYATKTETVNFPVDGSSKGRRSSLLPALAESLQPSMLDDQDYHRADSAPTRPGQSPGRPKDRAQEHSEELPQILPRTQPDSFKN